MALLGAVLRQAETAKAQVYSVSCADLSGATPLRKDDGSALDNTGRVGLDVVNDTAVFVYLDRNPATASAARLAFTAHDPDNDREIDIWVGGVAASSLAPIDGFHADFDERSFSYSVPLQPSQLVQGANAITFRDQNGGSILQLLRVCLELENATPLSPPPLEERFCSESVLAPDVYTRADGVGLALSGGNTAQAQGAVTVRIDTEVETLASIEVEGVVFVAAGYSGARSLQFSSSGSAATLSFTARGAHDQYPALSPAVGASLVSGGTAAAPGVTSLSVSNLTAIRGRLWEACVVVQHPPPLPPELDAGSIEPDGGDVAPDGGAVAPDAGPADAGPIEPDGGVVAPDAGPADAGPTEPDGGVVAPDAGLADAGPIEPDGGGVDGGDTAQESGPATSLDGGGETVDGGAAGGDAGQEPPGEGNPAVTPDVPASPVAAADAGEEPDVDASLSLASDDFIVSAGCSSVEGAGWGSLWLLACCGWRCSRRTSPQARRRS
ncbi:MAG: hypothetical protein ACO3JL_15405 [Myxococcota bacterium]